MPSKRYTLRNSGGQGCIFSPAIPCSDKKKKSKSKKKKSKKKQKEQKEQNEQKEQTLSKLMFSEASAKREITMDDIVRKIPGHEDWSLLWTRHCRTPPYEELQKHGRGVEKCLSKKQRTPTKTETFPMLVGVYGGKTIYEYGLSMLTKATFRNQASFDRVLLSLASSIRNVCFGIGELQSHKIVHADISVRNVVVRNHEGSLIDFGLAYRTKNLPYVRKHLQYLFQNTYKLYDAYPYEYIAYHAHKDKAGLREEHRDYQEGTYREYQEDLIRTHECIMGRPEGTVLREITEYQESLMKTSDPYKPSLPTIVRGLDLYSVGMLVPTILSDASIEREVEEDTVARLCRHTAYPEIFELFREMTEFYAEDRPSVARAHEHLCELCEANT